MAPLSHSCSCLPDVNSASPQSFLGTRELSCCLLWGLAISLMLTYIVTLHSLFLNM